MLPRQIPFLIRTSQIQKRAMGTTPKKEIYFSEFEVSSQVFYTTPRSYALVNIKPILPGHVLVVPYRRVARLTDLSAEELTDLFSAVQKVQRMLAVRYFGGGSSASSPEDGSFNVAIQDGREAGQTVDHVHCHIIPRVRGDGEGDGVYARLQGEEGNVGGGFWDRGRPVQGGRFPRVEDEDRLARSEDDMAGEADVYRELMAGVD